MKREILIKEIIDEFSILQHRIEFLSENNLQDINLISEYHIQELLNILFDLKLTNSNQKSKNCVGIDLEVVDNRVELPCDFYTLIAVEYNGYKITKE